MLTVNDAEAWCGLLATREHISWDEFGWLTFAFYEGLTIKFAIFAEF